MSNLKKDKKDLKDSGDEVEAKSKKKNTNMGNYIDDFYKELNIVNLINYYDRNDTQLQEATIVAATKIHFGETMKFTQAMMFDQLQIYKNKKKTLKRKIESYINHPEINVNKSKPFNDQLEQLLEQKEVIIE